MSAECICFVTDESTWFRYGSAVEPGSQLEPNPRCLVHFPWRAKVSCINWGHEDAPKATSYVIQAGELLGDAYHATWDEAMERANRLAQTFAKAVES